MLQLVQEFVHGPLQLRWGAQQGWRKGYGRKRIAGPGHKPSKFRRGKGRKGGDKGGGRGGGRAPPLGGRGHGPGRGGGGGGDVGIVA